MSVASRPLRWFYHEFGLASIHETGRNAYLIIIARSCRMFAYGTNSLILAIFFSALGYSDHRIGVFMTLTLLGDVFLGTSLTLIADRVGRRKILMGGSLLMVFSGIMFATFENFWILLSAAILGVISVTGGDFGPFRSIEESILSQLTTPTTRSDVLAWYVTTSSLGSSIGSEASGRMIHVLQNWEGWTPVDAYHILFWTYSAMGIVNACLVLALGEACELQTASEAYAELPQHEPGNLDIDSQHQASIFDANGRANRKQTARLLSRLTGSLSQISSPTRSIMYKLWFLLSLDSLADGMVPYSLTNYFIDIKFHPTKAALGDVTSVSYFLGAIGAVFAGPLARKIGLINTMVFTHIPSSAAVLLFPFPPVFWMAASLLLVRAGLNMVDQAPRAAFIAAVVKPQERTAVMGVTGMIRTLTAMAGPTITGYLASSERFWIAFVLAGICRLAYDAGLYILFVNTKLHQHEIKPEHNLTNGQHGITVAYEDEVLEMASLAGSNDSVDEDGRDEEDSQESLTGHMLQPPTGIERIRSRSPRRLIADDEDR